jgi:serine/threonine protein phosphatase 1
MQNRADIEILPGNTQGSDYLIGDVHGAKSLFKSLINKLGEQDRLMIVGDLTDRGEDSAAVLDTIIEINQKTPGKINAIRGNHEDILLEYLEARLLMHERSERNEATTEAEQLRFQTLVAYYRQNGGSWIIDNDTISIEKLKSYRDYIASLPYIIHVDDKNPYHMVHADMPFSDAELAEKIKQGRLTLSAEEIKYATWARTQKNDVMINDRGRTSSSIPVYCGHTILEGMRIASNSINLDVGSFMTDYMMIVNHTKQTVKLFSEQKKKLDQDMQYCLEHIFKHTSDNLQKAICVGFRERYQKTCDDLKAELKSLVDQQWAFDMDDFEEENQQTQAAVMMVLEEKEGAAFVKHAFLEELRRTIKDELMNQIHSKLQGIADEWLSNKKDDLLTKKGKKIQKKLDLIEKNHHLTPEMKIGALKNVFELSKIYRLLHEIETIDRLYEIKYRQKIPPLTKDQKIAPVIKLAKKVQTQLDSDEKTYASMYEVLQKALETCKQAVLTQPYGFFNKSQQAEEKKKLVSVLDEVQSRNTHHF